MNMRSLKTLLVLVLCSTFIESTRRVPARSCKYLFGRMITEMTSIKGEIGNLQENVRDLTSENKELKDKLEDHAENVRDLTSENQELKDKLEDLEVANTALQMQVNGLEETINEEGKLARTLGRTLKQKHPQPLTIWKLEMNIMQ